MEKLAGTSWRERLFALLCAVVDACREHGIDVFLYGEAALAAYRDGRPCDYPQLCIDVRDADRFAEAMEPLAQRFGIRVESLLTTPFYPRFEYRVTDSASIDFSADAARRYRWNGLAVQVLFIVHRPNGEARSAADRIRQALDLASKAYYATAASRPAWEAGGVIDPFGARVSAAAFRRLERLYSRGSEDARVAGVSFAPGTFASYRTVAVKGRDLPLPADAEGYLAALFGEGWRSRKVRAFAKKGWNVRTTAHSWGDFAPRIGHIDFRMAESGLRQRRKIDKQVKKVDSLISPYRDYLLRTHYHFLLRAEYAGSADELRRLLEEGDFESLRGSLADYLGKLEECRAMGLSLRPDDEVHEVVLEFLRRTDPPYADEVEAVERREARRMAKLGQMGPAESGAS